MAFARTVRLFLMDGSPSGRIKCSLTNWTGQVYLIPRTEIARSKGRLELSRTGIYFLFGTDSETGEDLLYIGQARERKNGNGVLGRIAEHIGEEKLDYFTHAIIVVTSDDSFGPTEISYLENYFYQQAIQADRVKVMNGNDPSPGKVGEEKKAELDEFTANANICIGSLGYKVFDVVDGAKTAPVTPTEAPAKKAEPPLYLNAAGATGTGRQTTEGFVILQGAQLRTELTHSAPKAVAKDRERLADRIDSAGVLTRDTLFSSPSAASNFLMGASTSGKLQWKNADGVSLGDLEKAEMESN